MAVSGVSNTGASTSAANTAGKTLADNFDTFLTLLTKQLQNQDPLSPMDSNQFTQQLVQYSGVEQSIQTNKNLEQMLSFFVASRRPMPSATSARKSPPKARKPIWATAER